MSNKFKLSPLSELFYISTSSVNPGNYQDTEFVHYSIPAYDSQKSPVLEKGISIKSNKYRIDKDSLLVSKLNPKINRVWKVEKGLNKICSTEFIVFQPICDNVNLDFYEQLFKSELFQNELLGLQSGTICGLIRVTPNTTLSINIPFPSLKEQQKIASILSSVDATIEKTEQVIAKTKEAKKGLMQQLLTKGIDHTEFKDSKVGLIPKSWHLIDFIGVADSNIDHSFTGGPFGSDLKTEDYTENGVRIIQLQNIKDGYFNDDYKIFTSEEKANKLKSCNIYPEEIIIAKMADPLARACLVPSKDSRYLMASDGIRLSIDKHNFDTDFVLYSINSTYFRNQAEEVGTGTTRLRIGLSALKKLQFKVPPLEEQKRISSTILSFDNKINSEQEKLMKLKECKQGLMQQLLTGQVRVKVD